MKKGWLVISLSAAMALSAAVASYAAGWRIEDGSWIYEETSGALAVNEWKKGADNLWRYLDSGGHMAVNSWVDDVYYVDENGIMVSNGWKQIDSGNYYYYSDYDGTRWYYFQENGKAVQDTWKKINNKWYHFDTNGAMETGWVDDNMYYCGDDGGAFIGWHLLYPPENEGDYKRDPFDENEGKYWYYFNSSGKKYVPNNGEEYGEKRIDGVYYCFNSYGAMQTGWVNVGSSSAGSESIGSYRFYNSSGKSLTGWYSAAPPDELAGQYENEVEWFYFSSTGTPKVGKEPGEASVSDFTTINGKTYLFNHLGNPVYGLHRVRISGDEYTTYFFDEVTRTPVKGRVDVEMADGTKATFHFADSGRGTTGVYGGNLYYMGLLQKAEDGNRYEPVTIPNHGTYLVNASGKVVKSTSGVRSADGTKYVTDNGGRLVKVNDENVSGGVWRAATEPIWKTR